MTIANTARRLAVSAAGAKKELGTCKFLDVRVGEEYAMGHIPGATNFSIYGLNTYDSDPAPLLSFVKSWSFMLSLRGFNRNDRIIVYENATGITAARAFWFLEYLGATNVSILDGGLNAWKEAGLAVEQTATAPKPGGDFVDFPNLEINDDVCATWQDVTRAIDAADSIVLDSRGEAEWLGKAANPPTIRQGTVPSAIWIDWVNHHSPDGRLKPLGELENMYTAKGITKDKEIIAFCNTGYRSAHAYLVLRLLGYPRVRNYIASWQEWGNREGCPVVPGILAAKC